MADNSLKEVHFFINPCLKLNNDLDEQISKAEALITVALEAGFLECPKKILHDYLGVIDEILKTAKKVSGKLCNSSYMIKGKTEF